MSHIPLFKLGSLVIKTLTKPLAKNIKKSAANHPRLEWLCHGLGQMQHKVAMTSRLKFQRGISTYKIKKLPRESAIEYGADFVGEFFIFSVAAGLTAFEYHRGNEQKAASKAKELALVAAEKAEIEGRIERIEEKLQAIEESMNKFLKKPRG